MIPRVSRSLARHRKLKQLAGCQCDWCRNNKLDRARRPCPWCGRTACPAACEHWLDCHDEIIARREKEKARKRRHRQTVSPVRLADAAQIDNSIFTSFDNAINH